MTSLDIKPEKKAAIFKQLASKSLTETGLAFDFDKHYKTQKAVKAAMYRLFNEVKNEPEKFGVQPETVALVVDAVSSRKVASPTLREMSEEEKTDIKGMIIKGRETSMRLINRKLHQLEKSPKALRNESLVSLGKIFGIIFDKAQIIQGQATEHVALLSKIETNMKPEEAIDMVLKMREVENSK